MGPYRTNCGPKKRYRTFFGQEPYEQEEKVYLYWWEAPNKKNKKDNGNNVEKLVVGETD